MATGINDLLNYCLGTRRGIAADRGRPAVGFVYIPNGKLVHFIFSLWPFSSENHAPKGPERKRNKPRCCWPVIFASILFSENEKGQRLHGRRRAIVHATVLVTNNEPCQNLRGAWSDRDTNDIFCSLLPYFSLYWLQIFQLFLSFWTSSFDLVLFKIFLQEKKNIRKTTKNALAPSIFIVLSIVLKLGTPLLHIQAQNMLLQNF